MGRCSVRTTRHESAEQAPTAGQRLSGDVLFTSLQDVDREGNAFAADAYARAGDHRSVRVGASAERAGAGAVVVLCVPAAAARSRGWRDQVVELLLDAGRVDAESLRTRRADEPGSRASMNKRCSVRARF